MRDVVEWLEALGLGNYAEVFAENDVGLDVLGDDQRLTPAGPRQGAISGSGGYTGPMRQDRAMWGSGALVGLVAVEREADAESTPADPA
jgi:hypothetical protein